MKTLKPPPPAGSEDHLDAEELQALIEEARQRTRRRRRGYAAAALVAAGLLGLYVVNDDGGDTESTQGEAEVGSQVTDGTWRSAPGLEGGRVSALAVDPRRPETVFAATLDAGVFKSANGARKWQQLDMPSAVSRVDAIAIAASEPKTIYAGTSRGVLKTMDGGRRWQATSSDLLGKESAERRAHRLIEGYVSAIAVDPRDADIAYAGTWEQKGIFKTRDGGRSWRSVSPPATVGVLALDPRGPGTVYAGVGDLAGAKRHVIKSTDGGATWRPAGDLRDVSALALDPKHPRTVYAAADANGNGIFKTTDGGASWRSVSRKVGPVSGLAVDPNDTDIVYAGTWGKGAFKTMDGGRTWRPLDVSDAAPLGEGSSAPPRGFCVAHFAQGSAAPGPLSCSPAASGISSPAVALDPRHPATIYAATGRGVDGEGGVSKSLDGGETWRPMVAGLTAARVSALAPDPAGDGTAYAAVNVRGVFKRVSGGWRAANTGLTPEQVRAVAVDPQDPATVYAGTGAGVFKSTNGAASWRVSFTPLTEFTGVHAVAVDPQDPATVYALTRDGFAGFGSLLVKSENRGQTWGTYARVQAVKFAEGQRAGVGRRSSPVRLGGDGFLVQAVPASPLAIAPLDPEVLYAGGLGVRKSVDGGTTWRSAGLSRRPVTALAVDPNEAEIVYASTDAGLFKSTGAGLSWQQLHGAIDGAHVEALAIDPKYHDTVYAGTDRGVFWSADGGDSWRRFTHLPLRPFAAVAVDRAAGILYAGAYGGGIYELELGS